MHPLFLIWRVRPGGKGCVTTKISLLFLLQVGAEELVDSEEEEEEEIEVQNQPSEEEEEEQDDPKGIKKTLKTSLMIDFC